MNLIAIQKLAQWNQQNSGTKYADLRDLRPIAGELMEHMHKAAEVLHEATSRFSPEVQAEAQLLVNELNNIPMIQEHALLAMEIVQRAEVPTDQHEDSLKEVLINMLYSLSRMQFTPQQLATFHRIASGQMPTPSKTQYSYRALRGLMAERLYAARSGSDKSLTVIREVLQNSSDAVLSPSGNFPPDHKPQIIIRTYTYGYSQFIDVAIQDNGIGMNWEVLSNAFFRYLESYKPGGGSTGGFGNAKGIIQSTPEQGWSVDTNSLHTSRFHKDAYMGQEEGYIPPEARVQARGTTLTLYKLPYVDESSIKELCSKFSSSDNLEIILNNEIIEPAFRIDEMEKLEKGKLGNLTNKMSKDEKEAKVFEKALIKKSADQLGTMEYTGPEGSVTIDFFIKRRSAPKGWGKCYLMCNGQYQFDLDKYVPMSDIVVAVRTDITPKATTYPMGPGRDTLNQPYQQDVLRTTAVLKEICQLVQDSDLFKEGLTHNILNQDKPPLSTSKHYNDEQQSQVRKVFMKQIGNVGRTMFTQPEEEEDEDIEEPAEVQEQKVNVVVPKEQARNIVQQTLVRMQVKPQQQQLVSKALESLMSEDTKDKVNLKEVMHEVIAAINTPIVSAVQNNFVSHEVADDPNNTAYLALLWQKVVETVLETVSNIASIGNIDKKFVPGLIFSDKALALYHPAKDDLPYAFVAINPLAVASIINPDLFDKWFSDERTRHPRYQERNPYADVEMVSAPTIERVTICLYHEAIHELTHLLFPDSYGYDEFHMWITKVEQMCDASGAKAKVYKHVKRYMMSSLATKKELSAEEKQKGLKAESRRLLSALNREKNKHKAPKAMFAKPLQMASVPIKNWLLKAAAKKKFTKGEATTIGEKIGIDWKTAPFTVEQFAKGLSVELEHGSRDSKTNVTNNNALDTGRIAWAHLKESNRYYDFLAEMERKFKA